jgi:hypothetical protein
LISFLSKGVWGWLGYTSNVSYLSLHPMVLPALAGYAAVAVGTPAVIYMRYVTSRAKQRANYVVLNSNRPYAACFFPTTTEPMANGKTQQQNCKMHFGNLLWNSLKLLPHA